MHWLYGLWASIYYAKRWRADRAAIRATIEGEGGNLLRLRAPGMFVRAPFPPSVGDFPLYFKAEAAYGERRGIWHVRTTRERPAGDWAWKSADGAGDLPVARADARLANDTIEVGALAATVIYFGVIGGFVWLIFHLYGFR